jgi:hypothetical protein
MEEATVVSRRSLTTIALVALLLPVASSTQSERQDRRIATFHIQGTITSQWDSTAIAARIQGTSADSNRRGTARDGEEGRVPLPKIEVTFEGKNATKTIVAGSNGFYQTDLPVGIYKMIARSPMIAFPPLKEYVRFFRITNSGTITLSGALHFDRTNCDIVIRSVEEQVEEAKDICGGEDTYRISSKDGVPLELLIRYPSRRSIAKGYAYNVDRIAQPNVPVLAAYNLFSLVADAVTYDPENRTLDATGNVVTSDGSGKNQQFDSIRFKMENGRAVPTP